MKMTDDNNSDHEKKGCSCEGFSNAIVGFFERIFFRLGKLIGLYPVRTIIISVLISGLCMIGMIEFQQESRGEKLWAPAGSEVLRDQEWVEENFPSKLRTNRLLFEGGNVLNSQSLNTIYDAHIDVLNIYSDHPERNYSAICFRQGPICKMEGILELWNYNESLIRNLTTAEFLTKVNEANLTSSRSGFPIYIDQILGGVNRQNGTIVSANAAVSVYSIKNQEVFVSSSGKKEDKNGEEWEKQFAVVAGKNWPGFSVTFFAMQTIEKDSQDAINGDIALFTIGYILIMVYLSFMLGKMNRLHLKVWLALKGIFCVGLAIGVSFGLCSAFQLFYGPVHSVLPFLVLGIGVDDIFVIVQSYENVVMLKENKDLDVPMKMALTMKHAGMAISVTSMTDTTAFLIGATTILPALRSFCVYAGVGIFAMFALSCTTFVAFLTLDLYRLEKRRDACCFCCVKVPEDYEPWECTNRDHLQLFFEKIYSKYLLKTPIKIIVFIVTLGILGVGFWGLMELKQEFDPEWFLPDSSKSAQYLKANKQYFPNEGEKTAAYLGVIDYFNQSSKMDNLYQSFSTHSTIDTSTARNWHTQYMLWLSNMKANDSLVIDGYPVSNAVFNNYLIEFLSTDGSAYLKDVQISNATGTPVITASRMTGQHFDFATTSDEIKGMDAIMDTVKAVPFTESRAFAYGEIYLSWNTNKIISTELLRNILLATLCVFLTTLILLANLWAALMVLSCVAFTLVNVAGFMHFWDLTIDTVSTVVLLLAVGLCVDYAVHIAHAFMTANGGSKNERVAKALTEIGPAVLNGGFSTFLAFSALGASGSYVFKVFFKVFLLIVIFGLFHGLVYLPCLLSVLGPAPYKLGISEKRSDTSISDTKNATEMENGVSVNGKYKTNGGDSNEGFHYSVDDVANMKA